MSSSSLRYDLQKGMLPGYHSAVAGSLHGVAGQGHSGLGRGGLRLKLGLGGSQARWSVEVCVSRNPPDTSILELNAIN